MQHEYTDPGEDISGLSDEELYFRHVIGEDHELLAMDLMLSSALMPGVE